MAGLAGRFAKNPVKATWGREDFQRGCRGSQSHALVALTKLPNLSSIHSMKHSCFALVLIGALTTMSPAIAASASMPGMGAIHAGSMNGTTATAAVPRGFMAHGVVNSVDVAAGSVNITHHAIKALGWPGMTMSFQVRDRKDLAFVKAGEKVDFDLARSPSGQYVITRLRSTR